MAKKTGKSVTKSKKSLPADAPEPTSEDLHGETGAKRPAKKSAGGGAHLVIVESPTKAKTINKYLGSGYVVMASVGHVRDLPRRPPKGVKQPVPGVDLEHDFAPTYEVMEDKKKTVTDLKRVAKNAADVWFATDLDREGEAIAWHLANALSVDPTKAKRVVFNAITKAEIQNAFAHPRPIDEGKVNAQQARRILDRIVGYQVSPLLWKKVAGGLSAGRVQSVATRLVVEREREIEAFIPAESWRITGMFATEIARTAQLASEWRAWLKEAPEGDPRSIKDRIAWLAERKCLRAEMFEYLGKSVEISERKAALEVAARLGFVLESTQEKTDPDAKGPQQNQVTYHGTMAAGAPDFTISSITTKRVSSRPPGPFITSTLQQAGSTRLGLSLQRTMRIAQSLYEGVNVKEAGGQIGLITYMRTDSTHISGEALTMVRDFIGKLGPQYLPEKPNFFASSNKAAQEAHEAIRPTDVTLTPDRIRGSLTDEQFKLYRIIWERFVACQMTNAQWDSTSVVIHARTKGQPNSEPLAGFRTSGRTLVFDGFYKVAGVPPSGEEATLPVLAEKQPVGPMQIDPTQHFSSPAPRYTEASLQKKLEEEGIGRPSTYAAIISTIQDREYVRQISDRDRRLMATDIGKVVTDKLIEGFPSIMDVAYTRKMELELDKIEEEHLDWVKMLHEFYGPFKKSLEVAHETMSHAKAETTPAPYKCEKCGAGTMYRLGRKGRFLSCTRYPDCDYAAPIDAMGKPQPPQLTDVVCPICASGMTKRAGRFGAFMGCVNYPKCKGIVRIDPKKNTVILPKAPPLLIDINCEKCGKPLNMRRSARGPWLSCSGFPRCRGRLAWSAVEPKKQAELEAQLDEHEKANPVPQLKNTKGDVIGEGYVPVIAGGGPEPASDSIDEG